MMLVITVYLCTEIIKFQNLGENGAEAHFTWEPRSGSFVPLVSTEAEAEPMPWES